MRRYAGLVLILVLPFLISLHWLGKKPVSPGKSDLTVEFVGYTNSPVDGVAPVRIQVMPGTGVRCVLFRVQNNSSDAFLHFNTSFVETNGGEGWKRFNLAGSWTGVGGNIWFPGYSCFYAVAWPPGLDTNVAWRIQLTVDRVPVGWRQMINERLHRKIFGNYDHRIATSSEVKP